MSLPDWLDALYLADEMRAADAHAIEREGTPSLELMERAGAGLARATSEAATNAGPLRILVGKGNNGGDGLVAARLLRAEGRRVEVLCLTELAELRGDARTNLDRLPGEAPRPCPDGLETDALEGSAAVVDALLGTGFSGTPREPVAGAIAAINSQLAPVIACDVPSGVDASTGEVEGEAVRASVTATFHGPKVGLHVAPGALHAGRVKVVDIGIARGAPAPSVAGLISERVLERLPTRARAGSKFSSGTVVVAGGARGLTGAPCMAALAAMRAGAGYVQVAVPASAEAVLESRLLEAMTVGLEDEDGHHVAASAERVAGLAERAGAVVVGPGIGRSEHAFEFARAVARTVSQPLVIDADGLNAHAGALESLSDRRAPTVLTPHAGELGRLLERPSSDIERQRLQYAREAAERSGAIVLLKGDDSIVAVPGGPVAISPGATPALATAGTGDVLTGVIAALLARGLDALQATAAGVLAHARAGRAAAARVGVDHTIASDVIEALPSAFAGP